MGVLEKILEQIKLLNERIDNLSANGQEGRPVLIDGKAALSSSEAAELTGIGEANLKEMARSGRVPYFMNGSYYKFPVRPLLEWMEAEAFKNMDRKKASNDYEIFRLTS